jgi:hypothetical protein
MMDLRKIYNKFVKGKDLAGGRFWEIEEELKMTLNMITN